MESHSSIDLWSKISKVPPPVASRATVVSFPTTARPSRNMPCLAATSSISSDTPSSSPNSLPPSSSAKRNLNFSVSQARLRVKGYLIRALTGGDRPPLHSASLSNRAWSPGVHACPSPNFPWSRHPDAPYLPPLVRSASLRDNYAFQGE